MVECGYFELKFENIEKAQVAESLIKEFATNQMDECSWLEHMALVEDDCCLCIDPETAISQYEYENFDFVLRMLSKSGENLVFSGSIHYSQPSFGFKMEESFSCNGKKLLYSDTSICDYCGEECSPEVTAYSERGESAFCDEDCYRNYCIEIITDGFNEDFTEEELREKSIDELDEIMPKYIDSWERD